MTPEPDAEDRSHDRTTALPAATTCAETSPTMAETYLQHNARRDVLTLEGLARWHASTCRVALGDPCILSDDERSRIVAEVRTVVERAFVEPARSEYTRRIDTAAVAILRCIAPRL